MCKFCEKQEDFGAQNIDIRVIENFLNIDYDAYSSDSSFNQDIRINYCPMCGRKLTEE